MTDSTSLIYQEVLLFCLQMCDILCLLKYRVSIDQVIRMKFTEVEVIEHLVKAYKEAGKPTSSS